MENQKDKGLVRELRPHFVWWGIEFTTRQIVGSVFGSAVLAGVSAIVSGLLRVDYVTFFAVFIVSVGVLLLAERRSSSARSKALSANLKRGVTMLDFADPNNEKIFFKNKVRFVFTNDGDSAIKVLPPSWIISKGDVSVQHPFTFKYQLEKSKGISSGKYKPEYWESQELDELQVGPGWSFTMKPLDLEKRRGDHQLGTIRIPVNVGDYVVDFEDRV